MRSIKKLRLINSRNSHNMTSLTRSLHINCLDFIKIKQIIYQSKGLIKCCLTTQSSNESNLHIKSVANLYLEMIVINIIKIKLSTSYLHGRFYFKSMNNLMTFRPENRGIFEQSTSNQRYWFISKKKRVDCFPKSWKGIRKTQKTLIILLFESTEGRRDEFMFMRHETNILNVCSDPWRL